MSGLQASVEIRSVGRDSWRDLQRLFVASEALRGCWCMWPRLAFGTMRPGRENETKLQALVDAGERCGLLAYVDGRPSGWCSVAPAVQYQRFGTTGRERDWLIACFAVAPEVRGAGVSKALLHAAVALAQEQGARAVGGLPRGWRPDDPEALTGLERAFEAADFRPATDGAYLARYWLTLD